MDKRIDDYIEKSPRFAQPVLIHLRRTVHKACPMVEETIKWGMPFFDYHGPMFSFAAFKQHCVAGFWKAKLLNDPKGHLGKRKNEGGEAMGNFGRITSLADLPAEKEIIQLIKAHMQLNKAGIKLPRKVKDSQSSALPQELLSALSKNKTAQQNFSLFSFSQQREYADWISEAKTLATKNKRATQAIEWISVGKIRNWKYLKVAKSFKSGQK